ncbi:hypothetical protein FGADI_12258 [Fusarium gaditjirri]|uniref:Uncharacterized protein n=1 Tax=Fusarium gaditjirri TaxID=282569 RepID=A0A8H4ST36_9HYPO|nr:hypothetical protein FGADI_12258 [Fusarium gaditjirri]
MSSIVDAAITKSEALKAHFMQWTIDTSEIKSPEVEYTQKRQVLLKKFDNELRQLLRHSTDATEYASEYERRSDAMLQHAGELKELEIQFKKSVTLLEQQFGERLEAAHRRLACGLFHALGDTLGDHSVSAVLHQCLQPQRLIADAGGAEECSVVVGTRNNTDAIPDMTMDLDKDQNQGSCQFAGSPEPQEQIIAQVPSSAEVIASVLSETQERHQSSAHQAPCDREPEVGAQSSPVTERTETTRPQITRAPDDPAPTQDASQSSESTTYLADNSNSAAMPIPVTGLHHNGGTTHRDTEKTLNGADQSANSIQVAQNQNNESPSQQPSDSLVVQRRAPLKRALEEASDQQQKRKKMPINSPDSSEERVIEFDQVFQDGEAQTKYIIVQHPPETGHWYILECKQHDKHFHKDPIRGASRHLTGQDHGLNGEHSFVVKMLGTRVLHCNDVLAAMNNRIARESFPQVAKETTQWMVHGRPMLPKDYRAQGCEVIPVAGEIYAAKFPKDRHPYPVLVLPWTAFDHFPWMKQLLRDTPSCYVFDKKVDKYPRGWAKGYEDGGHMLKNRVYPVVFFDKDNFPDQCDLGWVPLINFKVYHPGDTSVVYSMIVSRYLRNKDPRLAVDYRYSTDNSIVIPDSDDGEDTSTRNRTVQVQGNMCRNQSRNESGLRIKMQLGSLIDHRGSNTSISQKDTAESSRSQFHTQEPRTTSGTTARVEYPFISGGSEGAGIAVPRTLTSKAASTTKDPTVNVVELGEIHVESAYNTPVPQNVDAHSRNSLRPLQEEDLEGVAAETRAAMLALGPDIGSQVRWCDESVQKA